MSNENQNLNYFEFYDLPIQFSPDDNAVKTKFYALSKKFHPDFYANESDEKQQEVLDLSTLNNKAYQTLSNPNRRLKYVLELKGIISTDEGYVLPQSFLMEMMDVNESIMDLELEPDAEKLAHVIEEVNAVENQLKNELTMLTKQLDEDSSDSESLLLAVKDIFYRQKYIARLKERLPKG